MLVKLSAVPGVSAGRSVCAELKTSVCMKLIQTGFSVTVFATSYHFLCTTFERWRSAGAEGRHCAQTWPRSFTLCTCLQNSEEVVCVGPVLLCSSTR